MTTLRGVGVLVTRPEAQAAPLCRLLESRGATVATLPVLRIEALRVTDAMRGPGSPEGFDLVIFTSANAVEFGGALAAPMRAPVLAIGPATARALQRAGHRDVLVPAQFDSEHLLQHPAFAQIAGRRILIVKGAGGRNLLQDELTQCRARVTVAEVYRRERIQPDPRALQALEERLVARAIDVVTATSGEIAAALVKLATPPMRREFERVHWLVPGARVAASVREHGIAAPILLAGSAEDQALLSAVERWRASESGA